MKKTDLKAKEKTKEQAFQMYIDTTDKVKHISLK